MNPIEILKKYVSYPSVSTDPAFKEGMVGSRNYVMELLKEIGFDVKLVDTPLHPIVLGQRGGEKDWPHIVIYGHYDVQPADPYELWDNPPFEAEVKDGRIYARGSADNKGPQVVHICALAKLLKRRPDLPLRITYLIEGEEEIGSPSFLGFLDEYKQLLSEADMVLVSDTGIPTPDQIVITTGLRGLVDLEVELTGPNKDLHSGIHGGAVLNPIKAIADLCSSLHTEDGKVNLPGFYDGIEGVQDWEREELKKFPLTEEGYKEFLGVKGLYGDKDFTPLEALKIRPTLEFNGIGGGYQGEGVKTVIPSKAFVKITCRLVAGQDPAQIVKLLKDTLLKRVPKEVTIKFKGEGSGHPYGVVPPGRSNTPADQSPVLAEAFLSAEKHIEKIFGKAPLYIREGGSVPIIADLKTVTGLDSLLIGLFLPEDNLHAPNESFHLGVMEKAIEAFEGIIEDIADK